MKTYHRDSMLALIKRFTGQPNILTIPRFFIDLCGGDHLAALMLNQIIYWSDRKSDKGGWFAKTYDDWKGELALSQYQASRIARKLEKAGLIETTLRRSPYHQYAPTVHYRASWDNISKSIIEKLDNADYEETSQSDYEETQQSDYEETSQSYPETTSETTPKTTTERETPHALTADFEAEYEDAYDPRPRDVLWGLGMAATATRYGNKRDRAMQHPLVKAFYAGFERANVPGVVPPATNDSWLDIAGRMAEAGYAAADVTACVQQKVEGGKYGYTLKFCEEDMPAYLSYKNAPKPAPQAAAPRRAAANRAAPPLPVLPSAPPPFVKQAQGTD